ncbi:MAG: 2-isopropylmalate synthase [Epsilonproteobacteria bacterium]|nr:2-isopropylmalate synthase [Campylobacterota bacterium]
MKYKKFEKINITDRTWPNNEIDRAPIWCSVDLRDGNQSLIKPMTLEKKVRFFKLLVEIGFKEIEVGFPSASEVEYEFTRYLIDNDLIPDDVTIQILTQAREHLIKKSAEALQGAKNVIVHLYNSTSTNQREIVFKKEPKEIIDIAIQGVAWVKEYFDGFDGNVGFEYSPESFTQTELPFASEICNAVVDAWDPQGDEKVILNLPATVESSTPNIYADQIEWMIRNIKRRDQVLVSLHAHNDRGTAIAATELALMAGADRVEGTLLGNGERTGNVDIVTVGLNMYTQGVDPKLDFSDVDKIVKVVESANEISTSVRHPYVGYLVYTAFSGSHQDAIKKGMDFQQGKEEWRVPYLPIDPKDVGRDYEAIIRINSQSGKGGVSYILNTNYGYKIPKPMEPYVGKVIQQKSDKVDGILSEQQIVEVFEQEFVNRRDYYCISNFKISLDDSHSSVEGEFCVGDDKHFQQVNAGGIIDAVCHGFKQLGVEFKVVEYFEHALSHGSDAKAAAYFAIVMNDKTYYGVGVGDNISYASLNALVSVLNIAKAG